MDSSDEESNLKDYKKIRSDRIKKEDRDDKMPMAEHKKVLKLHLKHRLSSTETSSSNDERLRSNTSSTSTIHTRHHHLRSLFSYDGQSKKKIKLEIGPDETQIIQVKTEEDFNSNDISSSSLLSNANLSIASLEDIKENGEKEDSHDINKYEPSIQLEQLEHEKEVESHVNSSSSMKEKAEKEKEHVEFETRVLRSSRKHKQHEKEEVKDEKKIEIKQEEEDNNKKEKLKEKTKENKEDKNEEEETESKVDEKEQEKEEKDVKSNIHDKKKGGDHPPVTRSKRSSLRDTEVSGSSFSSNSTSVNNLKRKRKDNESSNNHPNKRGHSNESSAQSKSEHDKSKGWRKNIMMIWNDIANHRYGPVFLNPVKVEDAPDYYDIIKKPMDLNSIKQRVKDGVITSTIEFHRDVMLMCTNSLMYNQEDSEVYPMALEMKEHADHEIKNLRMYENRRQQRNTTISKQPSAGTVRRRISVNSTHEDK